MQLCLNQLQGVVEDEPRKEAENRNDDNENHVDKTVNKPPQEPTLQHQETNMNLPTETPRKGTHVRSKPKHLVGYVIDLPSVDPSTTSVN